MKYLFSLVCLFIVQKWGTFDRWLCWELPWYLRLPWCSLWARKDEFHPSLEYDYDALNRKSEFYRKLLRAWFNITRLRPIPSKTESDEEAQIIFERIKAFRVAYFHSMAKRKVVVTLALHRTPSSK